MPSPLRARAFRTLGAVMLLVALLVPGSAPALGADDEPLVLRAGTDQDLQVLNPWLSTLVVDYEVYTLNYDLLVGFGPNLEPVPGFADAWESSSDGLTHTFQIREGMTWSDGEPATCEDARWTYQLVLDSLETEYGGLGSYYLEPYLTNAGLESVICEGESLVVTTAFPTTLLTQAYVPILPKHVWSQYTIEQIQNAEATDFFSNQPPIVGTGPYQVVEWVPGDFIRFARNESYWGEQGAAEEVIIQNFDEASTMVEALRNGEVDYIRGVGADQFDALEGQENIETVEGFSNGYTYLSFNTKGNSEGYGGSTAAISDPAFRDALGYALDRDRLVQATLAGHGVAGDTNVPPYHSDWHVPPNTPRSFDLAEAARRLDAAGYTLDANNRRLDKEGNPITLRLTWPDSEEESATNAQFIQGWFDEIGITVDAAVTEEGKLLDDLLGPPDGEANWDFYIWGWVGDPDPMSLLSFFTSGQLGGLNDSFYSNERYDELFELQQKATDQAQRHEYISEMQQIFYDDAPYHVLYYDNELHAYRTDRFANWTNQPPENGTPLFGYGPFGYTVLQSAAEVAAASPSAATGSQAPSATGGTTSPAPTEPPADTASSNTVPIVLGVVALLAVVAVAFVLIRRRRTVPEEE